MDRKATLKAFWERLYDLYGKRCYYIAYFTLDDFQKAEDAVLMAFKYMTKYVPTYVDKTEEECRERLFKCLQKAIKKVGV